MPWLTRPTSAREIEDAKLVTAIETSFKASDRTYGARRIERFYNPRRRHSKLGYLSPMEFEARAMLA